MKKYWTIEEARDVAKKENKLLIQGYESWLDIDYYAAATQEEYEYKKEDIKGSFSSRIDVLEDCR